MLVQVNAAQTREETEFVSLVPCLKPYLRRRSKREIIVLFYFAKFLSSHDNTKLPLVFHSGRLRKKQIVWMKLFLVFIYLSWIKNASCYFGGTLAKVPLYKKMQLPHYVLEYILPNERDWTSTN